MKTSWPTGPDRNKLRTLVYLPARRAIATLKSSRQCRELASELGPLPSCTSSCPNPPPWSSGTSRGHSDPVRPARKGRFLILTCATNCLRVWAKVSITCHIIMCFAILARWRVGKIDAAALHCQKLRCRQAAQCFAMKNERFMVFLHFFNPPNYQGVVWLK